LEVEKGQVVSVGQPVVKLAQLDEKEIHFDIPEHRLSEIKNHQQVEVSLWSETGQKFNAKIREISATANSSSRTYRAKATLLDGQEDAHPGMTATVWIKADKTEQIAVPFSAVFTSQNQPMQQKVWLVDEVSHQVKAIPVQTGMALADELITVAGLKAGQLIVSAGVQRLKEAQSVRLLTSPPLVKPAQKTIVSGKQP
jgi:multidrug efflux system membrane fusion protein